MLKPHSHSLTHTHVHSHTHTHSHSLTHSLTRPLTQVYAGADGAFDLSEDDGHNNDYTCRLVFS